jgi:hypothetical protein
MRHLLMLLLLTADLRLADATCARAEMKPVLATTRDTHIPADGGFVVGYGYTTDYNDFESTKSPDPSDVTWTAIEGKKPVALTRTALAPGLSVYRPADGVTSFTVVGNHGKSLGSFTRDGKGVTLTAPQPKAVKVSSEHNLRWSTTTASMTLSAAPPPEAMAIIVYEVGYDGKLKPVSFAGLADTHDKTTSLEIFHSGGHCSNDVPGSGYVSSGGKYEFAYVDAFGRLSPTSKPIVAK